MAAGALGLTASKRPAARQASDLDIHAREIIRIRTVLNELIAQHTGQPLSRVEKDTDRDYFLTPEEAVEYGLIDEIIVPRALAAA